MRGTSALVASIAALAAITATREARATEPQSAPPPPQSTSGYMVGATLSYFRPFFPAPFSGPPALDAGPAIGVRAGYRWGFLYLGAAYEHVFLGGGTWTQKTDTERTLAASSDYVGLDLVAITDTHALVAAFFRVGAGCRVMQVRTDSTAGTTTTANLDLTLLGLGVQINAGGWRIVPEISAEVGPLNAYTSLAVTTYFDFAKRTR